MNARQFIDAHGWPEAEKVCQAAGTSVAYLQQLACGARRPSYDLAKALSDASEGRMTVLALLEAKGKTAAEQRAA